jgi:hypothetical protein
VPRTRPPYPEEFRREAIELARISSKSHRQIAEDLGISDSSGAGGQTTAWHYVGGPGSSSRRRSESRPTYTGVGMSRAVASLRARARPAPSAVSRRGR